MLKHTKSLLTFSLLSTLLVGCGGGGGSGTAQTPDGVRINLTASDKGLVTASTDTGRLVGHNYTHAFYGVWVDDSKQVRELRFQGTETPRHEIPTSGSATYYGNAVRLDSVTNEVLTDATSRINVNFGRKTVDGEITMPGLRRDITLHEGRLNGASYSGQASVLMNSEGRYDGKLYGPNAAETAGIVRFGNNPDLDTAFGGKRY
ncbi:Slam-dependent surface lipoprotein [Neisseria sp. CCUG12390]|uniref:Slam-dependent surface lipoprotein n=1 Tax=Neisseria sp. CCUG12390 TaxID=3392035 RepID=UPI003A100CBE